MVRELRLWLQTFRAYRASWRIRIEQWLCPHTFRPARLGDKPARLCDFCGSVERLTPEEFFEQFGERAWRR